MQASVVFGLVEWWSVEVLLKSIPGLELSLCSNPNDFFCSRQARGSSAAPSLLSRPQTRSVSSWLWSTAAAKAGDRRFNASRSQWKTRAICNPASMTSARKPLPPDSQSEKYYGPHAYSNNFSCLALMLTARSFVDRLECTPKVRHGGGRGQFRGRRA